MSEIVLDRVTKIFGPKPESVAGDLAAGASKAEILARTGHHLALHDVSLTVEPGEIVAVMGGSGSGKSTLLRTINHLVQPTSGAVRVRGQNVGELSAEQLRTFRRSTVGMVFQSFGLLPHLDVLNNVAFPLTLAGANESDRNARARRWLDRVGLGGYAKSRPSELSNGMRQRVGLARALISDPPILLMDEPFAALDPVTRRDMQDEVLRLQAELKKSVILVTHDPAEARRMASRVALLRDGRLVQAGTYDDLERNPADQEVAAFVRGFASPA